MKQHELACGMPIFKKPSYIISWVYIMNVYNEKWIKYHTDLFFKKFLKQNKIFWDQKATNGRKRYFHIDKNAGSKQIYTLLDDVERDDKEYIDNFMNYSDAEFIAEEEITQATRTQDTSLTTPSSTKWQSVKEERKEQKRGIREVDQKSKKLPSKKSVTSCQK